MFDDLNPRQEPEGSSSELFFKASFNQAAWSARTQVVEILIDAHEYKAALHEARLCLRSAREIYGDNSTETNQALNLCGAIYNYRKMPSRALNLCHLALAKCDPIPESLEVRANTLTLLSLVCETNRLNAAALAPILQSIWSVQDEELKHTSEYQFVLRDIGQISLQFGRYQDAEKCFLDCLAVDSGSTSSLGSRFMLAQTYASTGKWESAIRVLEPVVEALRISGTPEDDTNLLADSLWLKSTICREMGRFDEAKESNAEALLLLEYILGSDNPTTLICECSLYAIDVAHHEVGNALPILPRNLDLLRAALGPDSVHLISPHATTAELHDLVASKVNSIRDAMLGGTQSISKIALWNRLQLCGLYKVATEVGVGFGEFIARDEFYEFMADVAREHLSLARRSYQAAIDITTFYFGSTHPDLIRLYQRLGKVCQDLGKKKRSRACFKKADAIRDSAIDYM